MKKTTAIYIAAFIGFIGIGLIFKVTRDNAISRNCYEKSIRNTRPAIPNIQLQTMVTAYDSVKHIATIQPKLILDEHKQYDDTRAINSALKPKAFTRGKNITIGHDHYKQLNYDTNRIKISGYKYKALEYISSDSTKPIANIDQTDVEKPHDDTQAIRDALKKAEKTPKPIASGKLDGTIKDYKPYKPTFKDRLLNFLVSTTPESHSHNNILINLLITALIAVAIILLYFYNRKIFPTKIWKKVFIALAVIVSINAASTFDWHPRVFNVMSYGAKGDGVTDDTQAIQAAINACDAEGGGVVYFPSGIYRINGAINATYNAQIYIPNRGVTALRGEIILQGESASLSPSAGGLSVNAATPVPTVGTILKSTLTTFTTAGQAVIGTSSGNGTSLVVRNINIQVKNNPGGRGPVVGGLSWKNGANFIFENVAAYIDTSGFRSTVPSNDVTGIEVPDNNVGENYTLKNCLSVGFRHGYKISEHIVLDNVNTECDYYGFTIKQGYHNTTGVRVGSYWCKYDINVLDVCWLANFNLDTEWQNIGVWYDNAATIRDSTNLAKGYLTYHIVQANVGWNDAKFSTIGAANLITSPQAQPGLQNGSGYGKIASTATAYKINNPNDLSFYNQTNGNISILNDYSGGSIVMSAGGSFTAHFTLATTGALSLTPTSGTIPLTIKAPSGNTTFFIDGASSTNSQIGLKANAATKWFIANLGSSSDTFVLANSDANSNSLRFSLTQAGALQLNHYGAGTATFDASGNITSSSDIRLKTNIKPFKSGLKELMNLNPITYRWNKLSGNEMDSTYAGFSAQNVKANIPHGTGKGQDGYLTLQDRAIMATLVNAVKEQQIQIQHLKGGSTDTIYWFIGGVIAGTIAALFITYIISLFIRKNHRK